MCVRVSGWGGGYGEGVRVYSVQIWTCYRRQPSALILSLESALLVLVSVTNHRRSLESIELGRIKSTLCKHGPRCTMMNDRVSAKCSVPKNQEDNCLHRSQTRSVFVGVIRCSFLAIR